MKRKQSSIIWLIVIVVSVVASLTTVALLVLRARRRKLSRKAQAADSTDNCACMSFDVTEEGEDLLEDEPILSEE